MRVIMAFSISVTTNVAFSLITRFLLKFRALTQIQVSTVSCPQLPGANTPVPRNLQYFRHINDRHLHSGTCSQNGVQVRMRAPRAQVYRNFPGTHATTCAQVYYLKACCRSFVLDALSCMLRRFVLQQSRSVSKKIKCHIQ